MDQSNYNLDSDSEETSEKKTETAEKAEGKKPEKPSDNDSGENKDSSDKKDTASKFSREDTYQRKMERLMRNHIQTNFIPSFEEDDGQRNKEIDRLIESDKKELDYITKELENQKLDSDKRSLDEQPEDSNSKKKKR